MKKVGDRVVAISHGEKGVLHVFGVGVYTGDEVPPKDINPILNAGIPNPRILLDSGDVVWGCECWWGPESKLQAYRDAGYEIIQRDINQARERAKP